MNCPKCGHVDESHPLDADGRRFCSTAIGELPSCAECRAPMERLVDRLERRVDRSFADVRGIDRGAVMSAMRVWERDPDGGSPESLERHLTFLYGDSKRCTCESAYQSLGIFYGIHMGKGWVRTTDHPDCPEHGIVASRKHREGARNRSRRAPTEGREK